MTIDELIHVLSQVPASKRNLPVHIANDEGEMFEIDQVTTYVRGYEHAKENPLTIDVGGEVSYPSLKLS